jgi:hypothetical protein
VALCLICGRGRRRPLRSPLLRGCRPRGVALGDRQLGRSARTTDHCFAVLEPLHDPGGRPRTTGSRPARFRDSPQPSPRRGPRTPATGARAAFGVHRQSSDIRHRRRAKPGSPSRRVPLRRRHTGQGNARVSLSLGSASADVRHGSDWGLPPHARSGLASVTGASKRHTLRVARIVLHPGQSARQLSHSKGAGGNHV